MISLERIYQFITGQELFWALLWTGVGIFAVDLILLMETRWGQTKVLQKCLILSLLFHGLIVGYAATVKIPVPLYRSEPEAPPAVRVTVSQQPQVDILREMSSPGVGPTAPGRPTDRPWETFTAGPAVATPPPAAPDRPAAKPIAPVQRSTAVKMMPLPGRAPLEKLAAPPLATADPKGLKVAVGAPPKTAANAPAESIDVPAPRRATPRQLDTIRATLPRADMAANLGTEATRASPGDLPMALLDRPAALPRLQPGSAEVPAVPTQAPDLPPEVSAYITGQASRSAADATTGGADGTASPAANALASAGSGGGLGRLWNPTVGGAGKPGRGTADAGDGAGPAANLAPADSVGKAPEVYRLRTAPDRERQAEQHGATAETEAAVRAALTWLGSSQSPDGRWSPREHEGGRDNRALNHERPGAGSTADAGITGLSLLAMLASGHTHREGQHRDSVRRGLEFLVRAQHPSGSLAGPGNLFDAMYSHAIGTFAMSEAWGMTGDPWLREPVERAIRFTVAAQDPQTGGWRYRPGDPGDTSQLGWQFMALKSAELAGLPIPAVTRANVMRFLQSVASGPHSGLAAYRPNEEPTRTMTAEAIVCWQLLGMARNDPAGPEAGEFIVGDLPGKQRPNGYYWYYGTLATYQLQGPHWQRWNDALRQTLVTTQRQDGPLAGSWDPDRLWGSYGGRIYSTALSTLCLEVYYRFLPLYREAATPRGQ